MTPRPFQVAFYLLTIYTALHTIGGMLSHLIPALEASQRTDFGPEAWAVFESMRRTHYTFMGADTTWYGQWFGLGLLASLYLAFSAWVTWCLDCATAPLVQSQTVDSRDVNYAQVTAMWNLGRPIAIGLAVSHVADAILAYKYFFLAPTVTASLVVAMLGAGVWQVDARVRELRTRRKAE